jgi:hypothetical protein
LRDLRILMFKMRRESSVVGSFPVFLVKKMFFHLQKSNVTEPDITGPFPDG